MGNGSFYREVDLCGFQYQKDCWLKRIGGMTPVSRLALYSFAVLHESIWLLLFFFIFCYFDYQSHNKWIPPISISNSVITKVYFCGYNWDQRPKINPRFFFIIRLFTRTSMERFKGWKKNYKKIISELFRNNFISHRKKTYQQFWANKIND